MKYTKHHEPLSTAKALLGLFIVAIVAVLFYKFWTSQNYLLEDPLALRNYVIFTITVSGFLIGLLYLSSHTTHKVKATSKAKSASKSVKSSKKKKK